MKKLTFLLLLLNSFIISIHANPWGHRNDTVQLEADPVISYGSSVTMCVEWGEGDWDETKIGYGTSSDGSDWTWVDIHWYQDNGNNKLCKVDITFDAVGKYYYLYKVKKDNVESFQNGDSDWSENFEWAADKIIHYIIVTKAEYTEPVAAPVVVEATIDQIIIEEIVGYEYAILPDGEDISNLVWVNSGTFANLQMVSDYDVYQRVAETDNVLASSFEQVDVQTSTVTSISTLESVGITISVFNDNIIIVNDDMSVHDASYEIINICGQVVSCSNIVIDSGTNTIQLQEALQQGIYIVQLHIERGDFISKILVD